MEKRDLKELLLKNPTEIASVTEGEGLQHTVRMLWAVSLDGGESKVIRKAAKKALYIFRSQGIDVDLYREKKTGAIKEAAIEYSIQKSLLSLPDSTGSYLQLFSLSESSASSFYLFRFLIQQGHGIQKYSKEKTSGKLIQKFEAQNPGFFHVTEKYALIKLDRALKDTDDQKISGLHSLPDIFRYTGEAEVRHPVLDLVPARISRVLHPDEEKNLFKMREVAALSLPEEDMKEYKEEIEGAKKSKLILSGKNPEERVKDIIERLYTSYFTIEKKRFYRELLLDLALYYHEREMEVFTRILIDYADRLMNTRLHLREHPFFSFLVYKEFFLG
jgi:hypothetical protein